MACSNAPQGSTRTAALVNLHDKSSNRTLKLKVIVKSFFLKAAGFALFNADAYWLVGVDVLTLTQLLTLTKLILQRMKDANPAAKGLKKV